MFKLRDYQTKRALRKQVKDLKLQNRYLEKDIGDLKTDLAIEQSLCNSFRRENEKIMNKINGFDDAEERVLFFSSAAK